MDSRADFELLLATHFPLRRGRRATDGRFLNTRGIPESERDYARIIQQAGTRYIGLQNPEPELGLPALVLFYDLHGSCRALRIDELSVEKVKNVLRRSAEAWSRSKLQGDAA